MFSPTRTTVNKPNGNVINSFLDVDGSNCHIQYIEIDKNRPVLLYLHGTNNNLSCRSYVIDMSAMINVNLLLIDYSGYGLSGGIPSIDNIGECGVVAMNWLQSIGYKSEDIRVWGESIGSIPASHIAAKIPCHSIVSLFGISSFSDIIDYSKMPAKGLFKWVSKWTGKKMSNEDRYRKSLSKIIFLHSPTDDVVPYEGIRKMTQELGYPLITINGKHNSPIITKQQLKKVIKFMELEIPHDLQIEKWCKKLPNIVNEFVFRIIDR